MSGRWIVRKVLLAVLLTLLPGLLGAQDLIRYYPPKGVASTGGTFTGAVGFSDGTAALPGIAFASQLGTGLHRPNNFVLAFSVGGGARWNVNTSYELYPQLSDTGVLGAAALQIQSAYLSRSVQGSKSKSLTDAAAAVSIWRIAVPTNGYAGGDLIFTANSTDGTNRLTTTGRVTFAGADTAGTVTCGIGTPYAIVTAYRRANTLVCTFTAVTATTNCDVQVTCTDNLAGSQTMAIESRLDMPVPNTVTPQ